MTQYNNSAHSRPHFYPWRKLLVEEALLLSGLGAFGALTVLGGGVVLAQASSPSVEAAPVEAAPTTPIAPISTPEVAPLPESAPAVSPVESAPLTSTAPVAPDSSESYIDSTNYSLGATQRTTESSDRNSAAQLGLPNVPTTVQVGPVTVGSYGSLGLGTTTPSIRDYYNRTIRPPGRIGNGSIKLIFPLSIPAPISSIFGWRTHPITGEQRFHSGTDLAAPLGTPVLAAYAGRVAIADFLGGYGLAVALEHNKGTQQTLYGHLSEIFVKPGETVQQGMVIGRVGSTGLSTGPHLHFEFRQLTSEGWVALDAGAQLEYALAQLVRSLNFAAAKPAELGMKQTSDLGVVNVGVQGATTKLSLTPSSSSLPDSD